MPTHRVDAFHVLRVRGLARSGGQPGLRPPCVELPLQLRPPPCGHNGGHQGHQGPQGHRRAPLDHLAHPARCGHDRHLRHPGATGGLDATRTSVTCDLQNVSFVNCPQTARTISAKTPATNLRHAGATTMKWRAGSVPSCLVL